MSWWNSHAKLDGQHLKNSRMDRDEIKFDIIKECLKKFISSTLWIGSIDLILLIGLTQKQQNISIGQFVIPIQYVAILTAFALLYFTISSIHKMDRIIILFNKIENPDKKLSIKDYLNLYPSILNPFAQHNDSPKSILFDNLGLGIQTIVYLTGISLSFKYFLPNNKVLIILFVILAILLFLFRQDMIHTAKEIDSIVSKQNKRIKIIFTYIFIALFLIVYFCMTLK
jgi:hypothetical protein